MLSPYFSDAFSNDISLRSICLPDDMRLLFDIFVSTRGDILSLSNWTANEKIEFLRDQFMLQHNAYMGGYKNPEFMIVMLKGKDAGRLYLEIRNKDIRIIDIAILPDFRGKGTGSTLMSYIFQLSDSKAKSVSIHVEKSNPAMNWYMKLGFNKIEDVDVYDLMERKPSSDNGY